ncbi:MAG: hypothetical protein K0R50_1518 [Eubacterium sp.]|jgi:hypothetical protein|nr:hypothetical protein [Eubacterium sp.]
MKIHRKKTDIFISCLIIVVAAIFSVGIYISKAHNDYPDLTSISAKSIITGGRVMDDHTTKKTNSKRNNNLGNANYYNPNDGLYYADSGFKTIANDNTEYLLSLFNSGKDVNLPAGNYLCKTNVSITGNEVKIKGVKDRTKIVFQCKDFVYNSSGPYNEGVVVNKNHANEYNEANAQAIGIYDITFEYKRYQAKSPKTIMLFKNVKKLHLVNCSFIADLPNEIPVTNLDLYNACKNVLVLDCYFSNKTRALSGGCIWVRNLTTQTVSVPGNNTENVTIRSCEFDKDSKDEVISVYSTIGNVKDVVITKCKIRDYFTKQDTVLSAISSEDKYYGTVENVVISNNYIYSQNFNAFMISTGLENRKKQTKNVVIYNNEIVNDSQSTKRRIIIYNPLVNKDGSIVVTGNEIISKPNPSVYAIANVSIANENKITGNIESAVVGGIAADNIITGALNGIVNPDAALKNTINQVKYGIRVFQNDSYLYSNNIELDKDNGICGIEVLSEENVICAKNIIQTNAKAQYGFIARSPDTHLYSNQVSGEGKISIGQ